MATGTKYQVFISSTYEDLKIERDRVTRAVLEMGHIPVGMEMFSAADEEQWKIIARHIDESDYYVVIIAHRYGSVTDGISYTRKEYEYALQKRIPILAFVISDSAPWPADRFENNADLKSKLDEFKAFVRQKPIAAWSSPEDLHGNCAVALMKTFTSQPREGWVRAYTATGPEVISELTRLSAENSSLRLSVEELKAATSLNRSNEFRETVALLEVNRLALSYRYAGDSEWRRGQPKTLKEWFEIVGVQLQARGHVNGLSKTLAMYARQDKTKSYNMAALNQVRTLLARYRALQLAEPLEPEAISDEEYWTLTGFGQEVLNHLMWLTLEQPAEPDPGPEASINVEGGGEEEE